ncbi:hypothetical protein GCM10011297_28910 [Bacterioplanes sanyensis]|uniref:Lnb N-terminal periplasmic domain-containing protein n=1 Tax=Bacterioplanes sanyensis TaxID=1249553 RepID=UPI0016747CED|nr:DUF4105 domain-containing protein [Bacterioplanes sanyensis]GGY54236.1 hypothetical protein GCM10011297_28910 [Bacterioplanes sanyensis]
MPSLRRALCFMLLALPCCVQAELGAQAQAKAELQRLAGDRQWLHLLHYRRHWNGEVYSQNDSDAFFLHPHGKYDALAELTATVQAFTKVPLAQAAAAQCRFPARFHWLATQLPNHSFKRVPCPAFEQWRQRLDAHALTLIFPAAHINSPASMFGHTLLRLDREDATSSELLAYSVNFAANADPADNELVYTYKGLAGGYPGVVSVLPYYAKTNEYQHMEYRDIWEYQLTLTPAEVDQFVRHIWEVRGTEFDYFFFDENCSYRLLALIDAASERADLANEFFLTAIPIDTIRVMQQQGLVGEAHYRPSAASQLESAGQQATPQVRQVSRQLVVSEADIETLLQPLTAVQQVQALELSHLYARYLAIKKKQGNPRMRQRTLALLSARARRQEGSPFQPPMQPAVRDDQGHLTQRLSAMAGHQQTGFAELHWRPSYHDLLDLPAGYTRGSQIQMGANEWRLWSDGELQLRQFSVVDVVSLTPHSFYQRPMSWAAGFGLRRFIGREQQLHSQVHYGFGYTYELAAGRLYGLLDSELLADDQLEKGYQVSAGARLGWLFQSDVLTAKLQGQWLPSLAGDARLRRELQGHVGVATGAQSQLRLRWHRQWFNDDALHEWRLGWQLYY